MAHHPVNHHLRHSYRLVALGAGLYLALAGLAAAALGGNLHHRVNLVLGWALLAVAMVTMAFIRTDPNVLNISMVNVIVVTALGLVVLTAALYGKVAPPQRGETRQPAAYRAYD